MQKDQSGSVLPITHLYLVLKYRKGLGVFLGRQFKPRSDSASYLDLQSVSITKLKYSRKTIIKSNQTLAGNC